MDRRIKFNDRIKRSEMCVARLESVQTEFWRRHAVAIFRSDIEGIEHHGPGA